MPSVQALHRGHHPLPRGCWIRMRTRHCPGHRTDGSRPWLQRRPAPTGSHEDRTAESVMPDLDQPRRRPTGVARPLPAAGLPCGKTPRGPTAVARGRRHCRRPQSCAGGSAMRRRRLAHRGCRTRDLRLRGHLHRALAIHWLCHLVLLNTVHLLLLMAVFKMFYLEL